MQCRGQEDEDLTDSRNAANAANVAQGDMPGKLIAPTSDEMLALILSSLDDDKAEDVVSIPLSGKSSMADHMVVASGRSSRQVAAIAEKLADRVKSATGQSPRAEGKDTGDWVLIDCGDVIVHVFRPEVREFYQLEKMWQGARAPEPANA